MSLGLSGSFESEKPDHHMVEEEKDALVWEINETQLPDGSRAHEVKLGISENGHQVPLFESKRVLIQNKTRTDLDGLMDNIQPGDRITLKRKPQIENDGSLSLEVADIEHIGEWGKTHNHKEVKVDEKEVETHNSGLPIKMGINGKILPPGDPNYFSTPGFNMSEQ